MSASKLPALSLCPWCGSTPDVEPWHGGGPRKTVVRCVSSKCYVGPSVYGPTRTKAIARWNGSFVTASEDSVRKLSDAMVAFRREAGNLERAWDVFVNRRKREAGK